MNPVPTPAFTASIHRASLNRLAGEREVLTRQLDFHRATLLHKLEGLDDVQLPADDWLGPESLLGVVKHLAGTEQGWFLKIYAGMEEPDLFDSEAEFLVDPDETADGLVRLYMRTCERAREVVATGGLDDVVTTPTSARSWPT
jgi:hypothetical protein